MIIQNQNKSMELTSDAFNSSITRREFITNTGRLAAVSALAGAIIPNVHAAGGDLLKIALVGCGARGSGAADQALSTSGPTKLVAMADLRPEQLEKSLENLKEKHAS